jgi:hypothetical protein
LGFRRASLSNPPKETNRFTRVASARGVNRWSLTGSLEMKTAKSTGHVNPDDTALFKMIARVPALWRELRHD